MKEEINLLPPEAKHARRVRIYTNRANRMFWAFFVGVLLVVGALGGVYWMFEQQRSELAHDVGQYTSETSKSVETDARNINKRLDRIYGRIEKAQPAAPRVLDVLNARPDNVRIARLSGSNSTGRIKLVGISSSRAALIEYQDALGALAWVGEVEAPLQNFAGGEQNRFTMTIIEGDQSEAGVSFKSTQAP